MSSMASLTDTFTGTSIDTGKWTVFGAGSAGASETSSGLTFTLPSNFPQVAGVNSNTGYDLTGSYAVIQVASAGHAGSAAFPTDMGIALQPSLDATVETQNDLHFYLSSGVVFAGYRVGGSAHEWLVSGSTPSWASLGSPAWWRIREAGGIAWDTSPDGVTWTNRFSVATPFGVTGLVCKIWAHNWDPSASASTEIFANLNPVPTTPVSDTEGSGGLDAAEQIAAALAGTDASRETDAGEHVTIITTFALSGTDASRETEAGTVSVVQVPTREADIAMNVAGVPVRMAEAAPPVAMQAAGVQIRMTSAGSPP